MKHRYLRNMVTLELNKEKCTVCGICLEVCPHNVFAMAKPTVEITDKDACMECGACASNCPSQALSVRAGAGCAIAILATDNSGCCGSVEIKNYGK